MERFWKWGQLTFRLNEKNSEIPPLKKFDETEEPEARIHGRMTLKKILVRICLYCLNYTKFGQTSLREFTALPQTPNWI